MNITDEFLKSHSILSGVIEILSKPMYQIRGNLDPETKQNMAEMLNQARPGTVFMPGKEGSIELVPHLGLGEHERKGLFSAFTHSHTHLAALSEEAMVDEKLTKAFKNDAKTIDQIQEDTHHGS